MTDPSISPPAGTCWTRIAESAPWPGRDSPGAAVFRDRMWLLGGFHSDRAGRFSRLRDVWSSPDGCTWERELADAPWTARNLAGCVAFDGRLFLMGGFTGTATLGDIWSSHDGKHWDCLTRQAPWGARGAFGCTVHRDQIWVIGGVDWESRKHHADVWSSADGIHWDKVTAAAPWGPRAMFPTLERDDSIWITGGGNYHDHHQVHSDIWRSSDGASWEQIAASSPWTPRRFHKSLWYANTLWTMGGAHRSTNLNDVWASADGRDWVCTDEAAPWPIRHEFALLEFQGKAWLLGGFSGQIAGNVIYNDVWQMTVDC